MVTGEKSSVTSSDEEMLVGVMGQSLLGLGIPESVIEPRMAKEKKRMAVAVGTWYYIYTGISYRRQKKKKNGSRHMHNECF